MGMKKKAKIGVVDFVHPDDSAIDLSIDEATGQPVSDVEKYRETWEVKHIAMLEGKEPTKFKINFAIPYKKHVAIKNSSVGGFGKGEEAGFKLGNHSNQIVRSVLVDIINAPDMEEEDKLSFKRDPKTKLVSDDTMLELEDLGIVDDIYGFYLANKSEPENLKKS